MAIGLVGGLGQALTTGANQLVDSLKEERDRKRREGIEDEARKRINQTWDQQQQDKEVSDLSDANDVLSVVDPKIVPAWGAEQQFRQFDQPENPQPPADQQAPTAPSVARPTPGAGPVVVPGNAPATRGLVGAPIQIPGAPTSAAQPPPAGDPSAPQAAPGDEPSGPPPGWAPRDPQLA